MEFLKTVEPLGLGSLNGVAGINAVIYILRWRGVNLGK
jgi:hypothetical protein